MRLEGAMDASNIFKPALSRGELQCIGATTLAEHRKFIEKDSALDRRFQSVKVEAPSVEDTVLILKGIRPKYEEHHNVNFSDKALEAAAKLTDRYVTGRYQIKQLMQWMKPVQDRGCRQCNARLRSKNYLKKLKKFVPQRNPQSQIKISKKQLKLGTKKKTSG